MTIDDDVLNVFRSHYEAMRGLHDALDTSIQRAAIRLTPEFREAWSASLALLHGAMQEVDCHRCEAEIGVTSRMGEGVLCAGCADKRAA